RASREARPDLQLRRSDADLLWTHHDGGLAEEWVLCPEGHADESRDVVGVRRPCADDAVAISAPAGVGHLRTGTTTSSLWGGRAWRPRCLPDWVNKRCGICHMPDKKAIAARLMNEPIHKWIASLLVTACLGLVAVVGNNLIDGQRETNRSLAEIREALPVMKFQISQQ